MSEESNVWQDVRGLLERIKEKVLSSSPSKEITVATADGLTLGMYWRCVSLFRSVLILLDNDQPEEALILARSLFAESLRLMELEDAGTEREAILLGYYTRSLERSKALFGQKAERLGLTDDISDVLAHVEKQRRDLDNYRKRKGIGKLEQFSSEENAATKLNRKEDLWTFLLSHGMVHGEDAAQLFRRRKVGSDLMAFHSRTSAPDLLAEVGAFAARSVSYALYAAARIFSWEVSSELQKLIESLGRRTAGV